MPTEHKAVTDTFAHLQKSGYDITWLKPDADGLLSIDELESSIRDDTQLVSIMHINNETGVIQDIRRIGELCHARDILFHTDAAQSVGKLPFDLGNSPTRRRSILQEESLPHSLKKRGSDWRTCLAPIRAASSGPRVPPSRTTWRLWAQPVFGRTVANT